MLRLLAPRGEKPDVITLQRQLDDMAKTVDGFYAILGPRNWIFHESLSLDFTAELVAASTDPADAEERLITYYNDADRLSFQTARLRKLPAMRKRMDLVAKASADYFAGRYYATVHVLLSMMDGFVNEFETVRRGCMPGKRRSLRPGTALSATILGLRTPIEHSRREEVRRTKNPCTSFIETASCMAAF
ncbi:hypothetical protein ACGF0D_22375 [Kitasatospora sp. NPDC048298]|uniref:hypothetical protein n=1 Tax=Kitasatospora sp. NPDC048298 TaxID=3364049 RepID=UPI003713BBF9